MENYGLDPAQYFTSPGLAYDAAIKYTGIRLELLSKPDMLLMFENATMGCVFMIYHRFAQANNPYMSDYHAEKPSKHLTYLDANNLYGWAMAEKSTKIRQKKCLPDFPLLWRQSWKDEMMIS